MTVEARLTALGIELPSPAAPVANYLPFVVSGSMLFISGQLAFGPDAKLDPAHIGKVGAARIRGCRKGGCPLMCHQHSRASQGGVGQSRQDFALRKAWRIYQCGTRFHQSPRRHEWCIGFYRRGLGRQRPSCKIDGRRRRIAIELRCRDRGLVRDRGLLTPHTVNAPNWLTARPIAHRGLHSTTIRSGRKHPCRCSGSNRQKLRDRMRYPMLERWRSRRLP